jgi:hypothetical protein
MTDVTETTDDDRDAQNETDRRGVLRAGGLLITGGVAGLLGRPAAAAVDDAMMPDKPIKSVSIEGDAIDVDLVDRPELLMIRVIRNESEVAYEDIHLGGPNAYRVAPNLGDEFEVIALRGDYLDPIVVQTEKIEAKR